MGWKTRVYLWWIHIDIWQNQYNIVKLKNKIDFKKSLKKQENFRKKHNYFCFIDYAKASDYMVTTNCGKLLKR